MTQCFTCRCEVHIMQANQESDCPEALIQILNDETQFLPKILITDENTGEILADMLIDLDIELKVCRSDSLLHKLYLFSLHLQLRCF